METTAQQRPSPGGSILRSLGQINKDRIWAFLTILPSIVLLAIFVYGFIGQTFYWSLTDWSGMQANAPKNFIGLENYESLFSNPISGRFRQELVNTFFFTLFFLSGCLVLGFVLAVLLDQNIKGEGVFRTIFLFPMALSFAVTGTIWRWLLNPRGGVNVLPTIFGADPWDFRWINNRDQYTFNWHNVPILTIVIILVVCAFILLQRIRQRRFLGAVLFGVPFAVFTAWIASDFVTYNSANPAMHGIFNWQDVPRYVVATMIVGFLLYTISQLWNGKRKNATIAAIPGVLLLLWYATGGVDNFPNVTYEEPYGFNLALVGIIIAAVWQMSGYTMAMYLAGIRGIPEELREAARVDGCNELQVYLRVILPLLRPITLSAAIVLGHISLKIFDLIFAMAGIDYTPVSVPGVQVYYTMFRSNRFAFGSAIAIVLLIMVASVIIPYLATQLRSESEV